MGTTQRLLISRLASLVALAASAALLMAYLRPNAVSCRFDFNCEEVLFSRFGTVLGIPLPVVGVLTFGIVFATSLAHTPRGGRLLRLLSLAAGAGGLVLILLQVFVLHRFCPYCMLVDCSALLLAYSAWGWRREEAPPPLPSRMRHLWSAAAVLALGFGAALGSAGSWLPSHGPAPVPPQVSALWVPDKINIVEVADFQCPHCRHMHAVLTSFLREQGDRVHFVRLTAPMAKHPQARDASRAYLCAQAQGKGDEMGEALFGADDLTPRSCERLAQSAGVSVEQFRACIADPEIDRRIDADVEWVKTAAPGGLPAIWVQDRMLSGMQSAQALREALWAVERDKPAR
jgi:uncharacterized membrane protein/predicted DsbA family dithiol-disulfide isomerase